MEHVLLIRNDGLGVVEVRFAGVVKFRIPAKKAILIDAPESVEVASTKACLVAYTDFGSPPLGLCVMDVDANFKDLAELGYHIELSRKFASAEKLVSRYT